MILRKILPPTHAVVVYLYFFVFFTFHRALSSVVALSYAHAICNRIPGLAPRQRTICLSHPDSMAAAGQGAKLAFEECSYQFRLHRWNCTITDNTAGRTSPLAAQHTIASKEAAYTSAIRSAGVSYIITQACSQGSIMSCGCDKTKGDTSNAFSSEWKWGGCSADIKYGLTFSRLFLDSKEVKEDERALMNLHNNRAGRKAVKSQMDTQCKCLGVSGACTIKTCWTTLPGFRSIGDHLKQKFTKAKQVVPLQSSRTRNPEFLHLKRLKSLHRKPRKADLVYLKRSPSYCEKDEGIGSLGTTGRLCNRTANSYNNCDLMCCGRGYNTHQYTRTWQCDCKFHWCCHVTCDECTELTEEYTCK
ncbi:hypothetical protein CAPTEDRAFT_112156 [Capitella teleta]|uniref:Protein Wnt n=1 Tax=Capitella teleta TaxID=283909 RepID=R7UAH0_CAPTE|nr:hypothetical protein CAPTEDRAFT_112156 [Capitella teleta]|eukprot:ELU03126.1 hypothetical protein CAPTEDRAFT_112156 [Capitella teleta]